MFLIRMLNFVSIKCYRSLIFYFIFYNCMHEECKKKMLSNSIYFFSKFMSNKKILNGVITIGLKKKKTVK